jgi:outer membrane protein, heavy metal efflux system
VGNHLCIQRWIALVVLSWASIASAQGAAPEPARATFLHEADFNFTRDSYRFVAAGLLSTQQPQSANPSMQEHMQSSVSLAVSLQELVHEAEENNPEILAAVRGYEAASQVPKAAGALPDTELTLQHFSVGSPRPFAGYTNSDFAYIGLGVSQQIPYPGKRQLRSEVARHQAEAVQADVEAVKRNVLAKLKDDYFKLAYHQEIEAILDRDDKLLSEVQQISESRYRVGQGSQQEVLKAQLQHTRILREMTMHHRDLGELQAELKQLLNRQQQSPDIVAQPLGERALTQTQGDLFEAARKQNPALQTREAMLRGAAADVTLANREFRPDFNVQYMYQNTDRKFRDYYMASFGINLPNRGRRKAELAAAEARREQAEKQLQSETQKQLAEIQNQYVVIQTSSEQLKIYREGLIPQAQATFRAALAAYQSNRQDFETLISSFLDVLNVESDYQRELADHESGLAHLEALTGVNVQ